MEPTRTIKLAAVLTAAAFPVFAASLIRPAAARGPSQYEGVYHVQLDLPGDLPDQTTVLQFQRGGNALDAGFTLADDLINEAFSGGLGSWSYRNRKIDLRLVYTSPGLGSKPWVLSGQLTPTGNGLAGQLQLQRVPIGGGAPEVTLPVGYIGSGMDGTGI